MAKKRPQYHPPICGDYQFPDAEHPGFIQGETGLAGFGSKSFAVAQIPRRLACEIIIAKHYSRRIVQNSYIHLGVFMTGELVITTYEPQLLGGLF